jgi:hypothetical protein
MNISEIEAPLIVVVKTCGCREKSRRSVAYQFIDSYPSLCLDKKDLILGQLEACERLLGHIVDEEDKNTVESEIPELKMALDFLT